MYVHFLLFFLILKVEIATIQDSTEYRKTSKKKVKKIRQKLLGLKKKLQDSTQVDSNSNIEKSKYKNQKIKKSLQELQTQSLNNKIEISTLQELSKAFGSKIQNQDYEYFKQEGGIDLLIQICTSESTKNFEKYFF